MGRIPRTRIQRPRTAPSQRPRTRPAPPSQQPTRPEGTPALVTDRRPGHDKPRKHLTIADLCDELGIARSTFYDWRAKKTAPRCIKLPNGELRIRRTDLDDWLDARTEEAA